MPLPEYRGAAEYGQQSHYLTVMGTSLKPHDGKRGYMLICKCHCGRLVEVIPENVFKGRKRSCGCMRKRFRPARQISAIRIDMESAKDSAKLRGMMVDGIAKLSNVKGRTVVDRSARDR